nr:MAG TPA: hypothetical protein [Caudoviricetes sp.]
MRQERQHAHSLLQKMLLVPHKKMFLISLKESQW